MATTPPLLLLPSDDEQSRGTEHPAWRALRGALPTEGVTVVPAPRADRPGPDRRETRWRHRTHPDDAAWMASCGAALAAHAADRRAVVVGYGAGASMCIELQQRRSELLAWVAVCPELDRFPMSLPITRVSPGLIIMPSHDDGATYKQRKELNNHVARTATRTPTMQLQIVQGMTATLQRTDGSHRSEFPDWPTATPESEAAYGGRAAEVASLITEFIAEEAHRAEP